MRVDIKKESGPQGRGELRILKGGKLKVVDLDTSEAYPIEKENARCALPVKMTAGKKIGPVYYRLSSDEEKLFSLQPYGEETNYKFVVKYKWMPHREDEAPEPFIAQAKPYTNKKTNYSGIVPEHLAFNVIFEVLAGQFKGMEIKKQFSYQFKEDEDGSCYISGRGAWYSGWAGELSDFLKLAGMDFQFDTLDFTDNVLPALDALLSDRDSPFEVTVNNGWVKNMAPLTEGMTIA